MRGRCDEWVKILNQFADPSPFTKEFYSQPLACFLLRYDRFSWPAVFVIGTVHQYIRKHKGRCPSVRSQNILKGNGSIFIFYREKTFCGFFFDFCSRSGCKNRQ